MRQLTNQQFTVRTVTIVFVTLVAGTGLVLSQPAPTPTPSTPAAVTGQTTQTPAPSTLPAATGSPNAATDAARVVSQAADRASTDTLTVRLVSSAGRDWTPVIIALVSVAASVLAMMITARQKNRELAQTLALKQKELDQALALKQQELDRTLGLRIREQERAELTRRLSTFYGPLKQHLMLARVLHDRLRAGDPEHRTRDQFRTLVALLRNDDFSGNDKAIIQELVSTTNAARELIMTSEGIVEDEGLLTTLSKAAAHFRMLELAATKKITGEVNRFESSTFPRELDEVLERTIVDIRSRIQEFSRI